MDPKQDQAVKVLPPPPLESEESPDTCRLWVGNLDSRITEFSILKLLQKYGPLEKFDFIYHKTGPEAGKPRGYCFATYGSPEIAEKAKKGLDGKMALSKRLVVKNANADRKEEFMTKFTSAASKAKQPTSLLNKDMQIQAIEAKLKLMENSRDQGETSSLTDKRHDNKQGQGHYQGQGHSKSGPQRSTSQGHRSSRPYGYGKRR